MLSRRLQVLIDEPRHERLTAEAARRGVSVGQVVRDAIDRVVPGQDLRKLRAGQIILNAPPMDVPDDPADLKREIEEMYDRFV